MGSSAPQRRQKQPIFFSRFCLFCFPRQLSSYSLILHKLFRNFWSFSFSLGLLTKMKRRNFCTLSKKWLQVKILEISKGTKEHALLACIITTNSFIWLTLKLVHLQQRGELCFATLVQLEHKQEMQQHFSRLKILKKKMILKLQCQSVEHETAPQKFVVSILEYFHLFDQNWGIFASWGQIQQEVRRSL